jgi:hypothetical protein
MDFALLWIKILSDTGDKIEKAFYLFPRLLKKNQTGSDVESCAIFLPQNQDAERICWS